MRIKSIGLSWFRGAADPVALEPNGKSMVVYGANGSGKSSFVDAVEYVLNDGRIRHLAHEYSGKRQEKAVPNTHTPDGRTTALSITFADNSEFRIEIQKDGTSATSGGESAAMGTWDYGRTVLRQHEVAEFIYATKGSKYSALLPLLGLYPLEIAAENLRQLSKAIEREARVNESTERLKQVDAKRKTTFGTDSDDQIRAKIQVLHSTYCADKSATADCLARCKELATALETRIGSSSADQRRHVVLQEASALDLRGHVDAVRSASAKLVAIVEPLITEKLEVLQSSAEYGKKLEDQEEVQCPACGRSIRVGDFRAHIEEEQARLQEIIGFFDTRKAAIGTLCDTVRSLKSNLSKTDVKAWRDGLANGPLAENFAAVDNMDPGALRSSCGEGDLKGIEDKLLPLVDAAASASKDAPPEAKQLAIDKQVVEAAQAVIDAMEVAVAVERTKALIAFIDRLEQGIRKEIRARSQKVIDEISADVQTMWAILHPGDAIENVRLCLPKEADKAIDIGLKFHGVEQDSPRLTLSEGYRNSLGLCIFLAMAKREANVDRPLLLDDVVVSLDRNHRGMIVELLEKEFSARQVVILTHDREWYTELHQRLNSKNWAFKMLLPWESPDMGIRWSHKTTTFDDARAHLKHRPDSAGTDARKIMDIELALIAEHLQIRLPYLRGDRNDTRMAHGFLERFVADGKKCFKRRMQEDYGVHTDAIAAFEAAHRLLTSLANRASHTFSLERSEAAQLIDACEEALEFLKCPSCERYVWLTNAGGPEWVQCQCGEIRWEYGKSAR